MREYVEDTSENQERFYVYVYSDPTTGMPFYIGKGTCKRWLKHFKGDSHNERVLDRIQEIRDRGDEPEVFKVFQSNDELSALEVESALIESYGREGIDDGGFLVNVQKSDHRLISFDYPEGVLEDLGKLTDRDAAEKWDMPKHRVTTLRQSLGIESDFMYSFDDEDRKIGQFSRMYKDEKVRLYNHSGDVIEGNRFELAERIGVDFRHVIKVIEGEVRRAKGWYLEDPRDSVVDYYTLKEVVSPEGEIMVVNTFDLREITGKPDKVLFKLFNGQNKTTYGWCLNTPEGIVAQKRALSGPDMTIYHIQHKDGSKFSGTLKSIIKSLGLRESGIRGVIRGSYKTTMGWRLVGREEVEDEH